MLLGALVIAFTASQPVKPLAEVPFDFTKREVVVKTMIDGKGPYTMLLDTGTAPSVIDINVAKEIGLELGASGESGDGGGHGKTAYVEATLPRVGFGEFNAKNVSALATDLSALGKKLGTPIHGILGDSLFSGRVIQFDYPHRIARFYASSPFAKGHLPKSATQYSFRHEDEVHMLGLHINGKSVLANIDTGSNGTFTLTPRAIKRLGLTKAVAKATASTGAGFNGNYESRSGKVRSIQLGPTRLASPTVVFWQVGTGHDNSKWDVNVGNGFLQDYVVTIDYRQNVVTMQRPSKQ